MKTFLQVIAIVATIVSAHAAEMAKIDWEVMSADEIMAKVNALDSFRDVTTLMGEPHSASNSALMSSVKYNIGSNFVIFFCGAPENHLSKQDDLRKVRSMRLYRRIPENGIELVWEVSKEQAPERGIRSDHVDFPPRKSDAEQAGPSDGGKRPN